MTVPYRLSVQTETSVWAACSCGRWAMRYPDRSKAEAAWSDHCARVHGVNTRAWLRASREAE